MDTPSPIRKARGHGIKQVLVLRTDTGMPVGKLCAQASHGCLGAFLGRDRTVLTPLPDGTVRLEAVISQDAAAWFTELSVKVALAVPDEASLHEIHAKAKAAGLPCVLIQDAGFTHFDGVPTYTAVGIGPAQAHLIDQITGSLPLLR